MSYDVAVQAASRQWFPRLEIFFDPTPVVLTGEDILSFNLISESRDRNLVVADELNVVLDNVGRRFTPTNAAGPFFNRLRPGVRVRLFLALAVPGFPSEEVRIGDYIVNDWDAPGDEGEARFTAYDRLFTLIDQPTPELPVQVNTTVQSMFVTLFTRLGLTPAEYRFENVPSVPVTIGSFGQGFVGEVLNQLAEAVGCTVQVDSLDVINVISMFHQRAGLPTPLWTGDMIISAKNPHKYHEVFSRVEYTYSQPVLTAQESLLEIRDVVLPPGVTTIHQTFSKAPVGLISSVCLLKGRNSVIQSVEYGPYSMTIAVNNTGATPETATIEVLGNPVFHQEVVEVVTDSAAVTAYGVKVVAKKNFYVQSRTVAIDAATRKLRQVSDPNALFHLEARGDPKLTVFSFLEIEVPEHGVPRTLVQPTRIQLDFVGGLQTTIDARRAVL